jgi:cellulose biosynthesis protein BcsQ
LEKIAIAIINHKGGVGKTTLALVLSQIALGTEAKVAAVDLDPQRNFTDAMALVQTRYGDSLLLTDKITDNGDVIILDCPPALNDATAAAMDFADIVLVPVNPDMFSLLNLGVVYNFGKTHEKAPEQLAIVKIGFSTKVKGLTEIAAAALAENPYAVAGDVPVNKLIPYNIASGRLWGAGIPVPSRSPYKKLYEKTLRAYKSMLAGDTQTAWEGN